MQLLVFWLAFWGPVERKVSLLVATVRDSTNDDAHPPDGHKGATAQQARAASPRELLQCQSQATAHVESSSGTSRSLYAVCAWLHRCWLGRGTQIQGTR
jgi:hypothetical protein